MRLTGCVPHLTMSLSTSMLRMGLWPLLTVGWRWARALTQRQAVLPDRLHVGNSATGRFCLMYESVFFAGGPGGIQGAWCSHGDDQDQAH